LTIQRRRMILICDVWEKFMKKILIVLGLMASVIVIGLGSPAKLVAQSTSESNSDIVQTVDISGNSNLDQSAFRPQDRDESSSPYDNQDRAIIGRDNRVPVLTRKFPWSTIGRIEYRANEGSYTCTGSLIGRSLVLTNAHCLIDKNSGKPIVARNSNPSVAQLLFKPSLIKNAAIDQARVIDYQYGTIDPRRTGSADDWAILKIDKPLGDIYGYLGWRNLDLSQKSVLTKIRKRLTLVGYAEDYPKSRNSVELGNSGETAGMHRGCSIESIENGLITHRCDSNSGASGGPIFAYFKDTKSYSIVALHSSTFTNPNGKVRNRAVQVSRWAAKASALRRIK
jgi:protease YdgD